MDHTLGKIGVIVDILTGDYKVRTGDENYWYTVEHLELAEEKETYQGILKRYGIGK